MTCIFCKINNGVLPCISIYESNDCHVILDKFKLSRGHLLILSKRHKQSITQLTDKERSQLINVASNITLAMKRMDHSIKDVHFLINDGPSAYQHIPHVHLHLIPRYRCDTLYFLINMFTRYINPFNYIINKKTLTWAKKLSLNIKDGSNETNC
ncbi:HIT domain-containing protein [uncultured Shewanella sp.]|uniref:HIT family protein n=1 Tax=uncultured Shewanella sp. TaxID=173975 RepID=UPI00260D4BE5|nr:HIT domain-containing protein [uncultured Shewanella sp.]